MEQVEEGRAQDEERDPPESIRPPPWSPRIVEFVRGRSASTSSCLASSRLVLTSALTRCCCCFAFYTGVEIWSLDSPVHLLVAARSLAHTVPTFFLASERIRAFRILPPPPADTIITGIFPER